MGKLKIDPQGMKLLNKHIASRLHTEVQTNIIPFAKLKVRVDTGRLRESIHADFPKKDGDVVRTTVVFGGTQEYPTARDDGKMNRLVDYAAALEWSTHNISDDIIFLLLSLY